MIVKERITKTTVKKKNPGEQDDFIRSKKLPSFVNNEKLIRYL